MGLSRFSLGRSSRVCFTTWPIKPTAAVISGCSCEGGSFHKPRYGYFKSTFEHANNFKRRNRRMTPLGDSHSCRRQRISKANTDFLWNAWFACNYSKYLPLSAPDLPVVGTQRGGVGWPLRPHACAPSANSDITPVNRRQWLLRRRLWGSCRENTSVVVLLYCLVV